MPGEGQPAAYAASDSRENSSGGSLFSPQTIRFRQADHSKTGMKDATDLELFRHTLTALKDIARFLKHMFYMRVSDVDAAFP